MDIDELKERVVEHFVRSYDLETAMMKADLTTEEKSMLQRDTSFMFRIDYLMAEVRENIVTTMVDNMNGHDEKLAQKAAVDLGKILWAEKFSGKPEAPKGQVPDTIVLKGAKPE